MVLLLGALLVSRTVFSVSWIVFLLYWVSLTGRTRLSFQVLITEIIGRNAQYVVARDWYIFISLNKQRCVVALFICFVFIFYLI